MKKCKPKTEILSRITNYLGNGGLFNPELMEHDKVRDLILDCRETLSENEFLLLSDEQQDNVVFELYAMIANQGESFKTNDSLVFAKLMILCATQNLSIAIQRAKVNFKWKE